MFDENMIHLVPEPMMLAGSRQEDSDATSSFSYLKGGM